MRYWLVMPAAGSGRRFGSELPKQYATLAGRTVMEWALARFVEDERCAQIVVALAADDAWFPRVAARHPALTVAVGGAQRSLSVRSALAALAGRAEASDWVLVHDAARPCLSAADLERLLGTLAEDALGGLLAVPAADTLKQGTAGADAAATVAQTLDRSTLWRALTPQMFRYAQLCTALDQAHAAGRFATDESQALEWLGEHPRLVPGAPSNLKVTTAEDLVIAAAILGARGAPGIDA
jgi:2-C-methyl-D-erythritol 4-phosphate cytidylyltransferase